MKYISKINFFAIWVLLLGAVLTSCKDEDDSIIESERQDINLASFLGSAPELSFKPYAEIATRSFIDFDLKNQFNLGANISQSEIDAVLASFSEEINNGLSDFVVTDLDEYSNFNVDNGIMEGERVNVTLSNVADLFPLKNSTIEFIRDYIVRFDEALNRQRAFAVEIGDDPSLITVDKVNIGPLNLKGDNVYNVFDLLNADSSFTVLLTRKEIEFPVKTVIVDKSTNADLTDVKVSVDDGTYLTKFLLDNLFNQKITFNDLTAAKYTSISGNEIEFMDVVKKELVKGVETDITIKRAIAGTADDAADVPKGDIADTIVDRVFNDIGESTNGIIHQVDVMIDTITGDFDEIVN